MSQQQQHGTDRQTATSFGLILQQQAFRMKDSFSEARQVLKAVLQQGYISQVGHPSLSPRNLAPPISSSGMGWTGQSLECARRLRH